MLGDLVGPRRCRVAVTPEGRENSTSCRAMHRRLPVARPSRRRRSGHRRAAGGTTASVGHRSGRRGDPARGRRCGPGCAAAGPRGRVPWTQGARHPSIQPAARSGAGPTSMRRRRRRMSGGREGATPRSAHWPLEDRSGALCAHREGPYGVAHWTTQVERWPPTLSADLRTIRWRVVRRAGPCSSPANDYALGLYNGDTGVIVARPDGVLRAVFAREGSHVPAPAPPGWPPCRPCTR